jgi:ribosomal protein L9
MKKLLDKKKVEEYLSRGLEENPDTPFGKYIGGVRKTQEGYKRFFLSSAGIASHNSEEMIQAREDYRKMIEDAKKVTRDRQIADAERLEQQARELRAKANEEPDDEVR